MLSFYLKCILRGHSGWVTSIATTPERKDMIVSGSRDKKLIIWSLTPDDTNYGYPKRALTGHSHFIQDVVISTDGQFALSGSWDGTLRLWDLNSGVTVRRFVGHKKDVLSVAFSTDNRQIVSSSRDGTIKLWNTLGECKFTIEENCHALWPSCVKFSPTTATNPNTYVVSGGWDKMVKVWSLQNCKLVENYEGHTGYVNSVAIAPDSSLCASGGQDNYAIIWDLNTLNGKALYKLEAGSVIHALCFSPVHFWLCAATEKGIRIWDLETKSIVAELKASGPDDTQFYADGPCKTEPLSLAWSHDGTTLYAGYTDHCIRVWSIPSL